MDVYINGQKIRVDPKRAIAKGGEADIFDIGHDKLLKLFKQPDHPDYQGLPHEQQAARDRLQLHQQKLPQFPNPLPPRVIAPNALATDKAGRTIRGYTMPFLKDTNVLLRYGERSFRQTGISHQTVVHIFQDLHDTLSKLHFQQIVIGDFNDLNVLVRDTEAYLIDADSFQFSSFPCRVFTSRFLDPLLCDSQASQPILCQSYNPDSDWYAFTVMLMQCLLFVEPYGGVYKPKDLTQKIPQLMRSLKRITVFHSEVQYPKPAIPYRVLPDELLHHFHQVFERDVRGVFPRSLLDHLRWTRCTTCGTEHARPVCPECTHTPKSIPAIALVRGTVTATRLFTTEGIILFATVEQGQLRWLYHDQNQFRREDGSTVLGGALNPQLRWRIQGKTTLLGYQGQVIRLPFGQATERLAVDSRNAIALFDANDKTCCWVTQDQLQRRHINHSQSLIPYAQSYIGDVLSEQTWFWIGTQFGVGFYQAGNLKVAFVFDVQHGSMSDRVSLPRWQGQLIDATCTFSDRYAWLFLTIQEQGLLQYRCVVIQANGDIVATAQAHEGEESWLTMLQRGRSHSDTCPYCAVNNFLLAATDEGIIRIELQQGQLMQTKAFPDTEPFVDRDSRLFIAPHGLYVVNPHTIYQLQMA
ncbi:MAG TPA: hypothetical protein V6C78_00240 [Crinalium sp.]